MTIPSHGVTADRRLDLLRWMVAGRETERVICKADGHWHAAYGEEAVVVGSFLALRPDDVGLSHYRGALIASLVRGADLRRLLAGVLGKVTGPSRGRWRSDTTGEVGPNHLALFSGCLGPSLGYAAGAALAAKLNGTERVAMVTFGDGTVNSGLFHESLNLAAMLKLPVIFVCQDNQYAISTPSSVAIPGSLRLRAEGYGIRAMEVDGNDAVAVFDAVGLAAQRARSGEGPTFVHAMSYRLGGHWATDSMAYRSPGESEKWAALDPVARLSQELMDEGRLTAEAFAAMSAEAAARAGQALAQAEADPWPDASVIEGDVYAPIC